MSIKWLVPIIALSGPFLFAWPVTTFFTLIATYLFPPTALIVGVVMDSLYAPSIPYYATLVGTVLTFGSYFVQKLVKRHII